MVEDGAQKFVETVGPEYPFLCEDTKAVRLMSDPSSKQRLIIYETISGASNEVIEPFILFRDEKNSTYLVNQAQTDWPVDRDIWNYTVAQVRRVLQRY